MPKFFGVQGQKLVADKNKHAFVGFHIDPNLFGKSCTIVDPEIRVTQITGISYIRVKFDGNGSPLPWSVPLICLSFPVEEAAYEPRELDPRIEKHVPHDDD